jgi:hypothetical protein
MNKERPFLKAKFAVVDLTETVHLFELNQPVGFIEEKHGMIKVHLKGIPIREKTEPEKAGADG